MLYAGQSGCCISGRNGSRSMLSFRQVAREGTKKTVFTNFPELCRAMNRSQEHCMAFLLAVRDNRIQFCRHSQWHFCNGW
jgi:translation initiation factor 2 beta subunit (eIF-2beta)/eIF-5